MHTETKQVYVCDYCKKEFDGSNECLLHEKKMHTCLKCKHNFLLYGVEQSCDVEKCQFEPKSE